MNSDSRLRPLRGIIPPVVTPLASLTALDHKGLETIIEHILAGAVHALFILGTTGEGPALSYAVRRELIERVCRQVGNRVPVLVGITDTAYIESLRLAEHAAYSGASAVVAAPPYYFPVSQSDLLRLIEGWARESALPVYLYNQPALTKVNFDPQTVQLASNIPNVFGIKDSSGEISYFKEVLDLVRDKPEFSVLVGPEHLLAEALMCGAHGGVPGGANIFPKLPVLLYQAFLQGSYQEMEKIQAEMVNLGLPIFQPGEADSGYIRRLKFALSRMNICSDLLAGPYQQASAKEAQIIEHHLHAHGFLENSKAMR
ncbi:MAG: dihydrodipicolinate synthase family protein [Terriglobia bacterium]|nr:dihydrodipicolinate synthase family protein [Terriglobia bacterium]